MNENRKFRWAIVCLLSLVVFINDASTQETSKGGDILRSAKALLEGGDSSGADAQLQSLTSGPQNENDPLAVQQAWSLRGHLAERSGRLSDALAFYSESIESIDSDQEPTGLELASLLCKRANVQRQLGMFHDAALDCGKAISLVEGIVPIGRERKVRLAMAACLNVFGAVERARGDFDSAQMKYESAIRIFEQEPPQNRSDVARVLSNLGVNFQKKGDYGNARRMLEQALGMLDATRADQQLMVATFRHNLGGILESQGELASAKVQYLESIRLLESLEGLPSQSLTATVWASLGMLELDLKNPQLSVAYFHKALAARVTLFGDHSTNPQIAFTNQNLARALLELGDVEEAFKRTKSAIEVQERIYPGRPVHPDLCQSYLLLAKVLVKKGDIDQSIHQAKLAVAAYLEAYPKSSYPEGHGDIVAALEVLGDYQMRAGHAADAIEHLRQATQMGAMLAQNFIFTAAEAESRQYLSVRMRTPKLLLEAMRKESWSAAAQYEAILPSRRMVQRAIAIRNRWMHENFEHSEKVARYLTVRRLLNFASEIQEVKQENRIAILNELEELTEEKESLERQLADAIDPAADKTIEPLLPRLMEAIAQNSALVEIIEISDPFSDSFPKEYVGFVITRDTVSRVNFDDAQAIDQVCGDWLSALADPNDYEGEWNLAQSVSDEIWNPIAASLPDHIDRLYVCPDGVFAQIPWVALCDNGQQSRVIDRCTISLLPYSQLLLEPTQELMTQWTETLLVGDVDYGHSQWPSLPGSVDELAALSATLAKMPDIHTVTLRRSEATVENVCQRLPSAAVVHFATHGKFFGDVLEGETPTCSIDRNPLLSSGIVLAPSTANGMGQAVVTGEQIAALDLRNLQLATLSACDTGRGQLIAGDGVYGLQQAFHLAGAHCVVASRGRIDDRQTVKLMNVFYELMLQQQLEPAQALAAAQQAFRSGDYVANTVDRGASDADAPSKTVHTTEVPHGIHPYYWAAFQHSGH